MRTLLSSPCQLRLGVVLRHLSLSPYTLDYAIELIEDKTSPYRPAYQHLEKEL